MWCLSGWVPLFNNFCWTSLQEWHKLSSHSVPCNWEQFQDPHSPWSAWLRTEIQLQEVLQGEKQSRGAFLPGAILWGHWRASSAYLCGQGVAPANVVTTAAFKILFAWTPLSWFYFPHSGYHGMLGSCNQCCDLLLLWVSCCPQALERGKVWCINCEPWQGVWPCAIGISHLRMEWQLYQGISSGFFSDEVRHLGIDAPLSTFWTYLFLRHLTELILNPASGQKYLWHTLNKTYYVFCTNICIIVPLAGADVISDTKCCASCKIHDMSLNENECSFKIQAFQPW